YQLETEIMGIIVTRVGFHHPRVNEMSSTRYSSSPVFTMLDDTTTRQAGINTSRSNNKSTEHRLTRSAGNRMKPPHTSNARTRAPRADELSAFEREAAEDAAAHGVLLRVGVGRVTALR